MPSVWFELLAVCPHTGARRGRLHTPHGTVETPAFMPVGTQGTVKTVGSEDLEALGFEQILSNTYHLYLRPGAGLVADMGGLHQFMHWPHPILTDSGGFQVFSLAEMRKIDEDGVTFKSHIDGSTHRLTPEKSIEIQEKLGADIIMAFDECAPPYDRAYNERAVQRTHAWAKRCLDAKQRGDQALFGIVQGGVFPDLRRQSAEYIASLGFPGHAIGGEPAPWGSPASLDWFDPLDVPALLPHMLICDLTEPTIVRIRLVGTGMTSNFGFDPTGGD
jgi:queuine tRNA-ribosyltransferase